MSYMSMSALGALGQTDCGPAPGLGPGESKVCCPDLGWVIYDGVESSYGICERAAGTGSGGNGSSEPLPTDPVERIAVLRSQIDARRAAQEEADFERKKQEIQLRFMLGRMQAVQNQDQAQINAKLAAAAAARKAREDAARRERNKKLLLGGGAILAGAKIFGFF